MAAATAFAFPALALVEHIECYSPGPATPPLLFSPGSPAESDCSTGAPNTPDIHLNKPRCAVLAPCLPSAILTIANHSGYFDLPQKKDARHTTAIASLKLPELGPFGGPTTLSLTPSSPTFSLRLPSRGPGRRSPLSRPSNNVSAMTDSPPIETPRAPHLSTTSVFEPECPPSGHPLRHRLIERVHDSSSWRGCGCGCGSGAEKEQTRASIGLGIVDGSSISRSRRNARTTAAVKREMLAERDRSAKESDRLTKWKWAQ